MGLNRNIGDLEPRTRRAAEAGLELLKAQGIRYFVNETRRSKEVQAAYWLKGREPLDVVNIVRALVGLWPLSEKDNASIATQTMKSKHLDGLALDICPADVAGAPLWNAPREEYEKIAAVMKSVGFEWGGDWKGSWDQPHYQIKDVV